MSTSAHQLDDYPDAQSSQPSRHRRAGSALARRIAVPAWAFFCGGGLLFLLGSGIGAIASRRSGVPSLPLAAATQLMQSVGGETDALIVPHAGERLEMREIPPSLEKDLEEVRTLVSRLMKLHLDKTQSKPADREWFARFGRLITDIREATSAVEGESQMETVGLRMALGQLDMAAFASRDGMDSNMVQSLCLVIDYLIDTLIYSKQYPPAPESR